MKKTVTLHFYNEEYMLPWWLNHHKKYFDHGVLINYHSTDRSVEVIKEICPDWDIVTSRNQDFGVTGLDNEIMDIEANIDGWRMSLSVTEFLVGDYSLMDNVPNSQLICPTVTFFDWNPTGSMDHNVELWNQNSKVISYHTDPHFRIARSAHNFPIKYPIGGRHFKPDRINTHDLVVFHFGNCITSPEMLSRRLQIQHRIPQSDKQNRWGHNHFGWFAEDRVLTEERLAEHYEQEKHKITEASEFINKLGL
jgi:hypothetical protein